MAKDYLSCCEVDFDLLTIHCCNPALSEVKSQPNVKWFSVLQLPFLSSRAVQLGSLYVRGLGHLLGANCASSGPLPNAALLPWHNFDGRLFHLKYLQAQSGVEKVVLLESDVSINKGRRKCCTKLCVFRLTFFYPFHLFQSFLSLFLCLRGKLMETCRKKGRILESRPNKRDQGHKITPGTSFNGRLTGW